MATQTRVLKVDPFEPDDAILDEAAQVLRDGGLVAFPTETVYGLGADATNPRAVARIFEAKGRPAFNPLIVHADGPSRVEPYVEFWPPAAERLAAEFWPGPLTLVLPRTSLVPDVVTAAAETVAIRVPELALTRRLIERLGFPIAAPSANRFNGISPTQASHVLKDLDGRIDLLLDGGPTALGLESTVLDLTTRIPRLLRPGAITVNQLQHSLGGPKIRNTTSGPSTDRPMSPGQLAVHYAPKTPTLRIEDDDLGQFDWPEGVALLLIGGHALPILPSHVRPVVLLTPEIAAASFYAALHAFDEAGVSLIVIVPPPDRIEWQALRDRLWRASRPWPE